MDQKERSILEARLADCVRQCELRSVPKFVGFLDFSGAALAVTVARRENAKYMLFGGAEGCERVCFGVFPDWCEPQTQQFPIVRLLINNKSTRKLQHRDILGAFMSAGIERDTVGDIFVGDGDCTVFVIDSVAPHIMAYVDKIASAGVEIVRDDSEGLPETGGFIELHGTVASLRVDCVVAEVGNCSRSKASELISTGLVAVNGLEVQKPTAEIKNGDTLTVRRIGKFVIDSTDRTTKKGRIALDYRKYN